MHTRETYVVGYRGDGNITSIPVPLTNCVRPLIDGYFAIYDTVDMTPRTMQRILKRVANHARINHAVSSHMLRHTFGSRTPALGPPSTHGAFPPAPATLGDGMGLGKGGR